MSGCQEKPLDTKNQGGYTMPMDGTGPMSNHQKGTQNEAGIPAIVCL
jgi:hypothetical protein